MKQEDAQPRIHIWTDGGSRGNPGVAGIGAVARRESHGGPGETLFTLAEYLGTTTNNYAEYTAVIRALEVCIEKHYTHSALSFRLDSKLVVEQVQGNWKVKEPSLIPLVTRARDLVAHFPTVTFTHIPREENAEADALANEAMDRGA